MEKITPEYLRQRMKYNPETGKLYWLERNAEHFPSDGEVSPQTLANRFNGSFAGKEAFTAECYGYRSGALMGKYYKAHRVAWAIYYGEWPSDYIDHINLDRGDNRITNLREATSKENARNTSSAKGSSSKYLGVSRSSRPNKPWLATIKVDRKTIGLGRWVTEEDAANAYNIAATKHFGEFASLNSV